MVQATPSFERQVQKILPFKSLKSAQQVDNACHASKCVAWMSDVMLGHDCFPCLLSKLVVKISKCDILHFLHQYQAERASKMCLPLREKVWWPCRKTRPTVQTWRQ